MIKLIDPTKGATRDPFTGQLWESPIKTIPVEQAVEKLGREVKNYPELDLLNDSNTIILGFAPKYIPDAIANYVGTFPDPKVGKILNLANNLGYFVSSVKYKLDNEIEQYYQKYTSSFFRDLILDKQPTYIILFFEARYSPVF